MNYFSRNKIWGIAFLLLVLLNIAALVTFWIMREGPAGPRGGEMKQGVVDFMVKELGFDSVQKEQLMQLRKTYQEEMREVRSRNRDAKNDFFALLPQSGISDTALENAAHAAVVYDIKTDMLTFRHFQAVRKLCNAEQQKKFDAVIQEVLRMSAPGGPGNRPGPRGAMGGERPEGPPPPGDRREPPPPQE